MIPLTAFIRNEERFQINDQNFHWKKLDKEKQEKQPSKKIRRKEITKIRAETNEIENRKIWENEP